MTNQAVRGYLERLLEIRFELTQSEDREIAEIARTEFGDGASQLIGHILPNQLVDFMERLVEWNFNGKLTPVEVADMFTSGRWLDDLPAGEVVMIMDFIANGDNWPESAAAALNLYLHLNKPLPKELIPFVERVLQEIKASLDIQAN